MAKKRLRVALIGCGGNMRGAHVPRIKDDGAVNLAAVADTSEDAASALMERWGGQVPFHADYRDMIEDHRLDAVMVSSPHALHYEQVDYALDRGLHVLVEKPLTISSSHTRALIGKAAAREERAKGGQLRLRTFVLEAKDADAIGDEPVWLDGKVVGWITSGGFAHHANASVALGYVSREVAERDSGWEIELLGERLPARLQRHALFDHNRERMRN